MLGGDSVVFGIGIGIGVEGVEMSFGHGTNRPSTRRGGIDTDSDTDSDPEGNQPGGEVPNEVTGAAWDYFTRSDDRTREGDPR